MVVARSWKVADGVAAMHDFLRPPPPRRAAIRDLINALLSPDRFTRRCAADLARRVSAQEPGILRQYADVLIELVAEIPREEWQARGWVTLAAALSASTHPQRTRLALLLRSLLKDERIATRAMALEAFAVLAAAEPKLRNEAMQLIERARNDESVAMRIRARRMLLPLMASGSKPFPRRHSGSDL
jgi:hypothetical protein